MLAPAGGCAARPWQQAHLDERAAGGERRRLLGLPRADLPRASPPELASSRSPPTCSASRSSPSPQPRHFCGGVRRRHRRRRAHHLAGAARRWPPRPHAALATNKGQATFRLHSCSSVASFWLRERSIGGGRRSLSSGVRRCARRFTGGPPGPPGAAQADRSGPAGGRRSLRPLPEEEAGMKPQRSSGWRSRSGWDGSYMTASFGRAPCSRRAHRRTFGDSLTSPPPPTPRSTTSPQPRRPSPLLPEEGAVIFQIRASAEIAAANMLGFFIGARVASQRGQVRPGDGGGRGHRLARQGRL